MDLCPGDAYVDIVGINYCDGCSAITSDAVWASAYLATRNKGPKPPGRWLKFTRSRGKKFACSE